MRTINRVSPFFDTKSKLCLCVLSRRIRKITLQDKYWSIENDIRESFARYIMRDSRPRNGQGSVIPVVSLIECRLEQMMSARTTQLFEFLTESEIINHFQTSQISTRILSQMDGTHDQSKRKSFFKSFSFTFFSFGSFKTV